MKIKSLVSLFLSIVMIFGFATSAFAQEIIPQYAITDEYVIIDSVVYEINNNTIQYEGKTFEIIDYTLVSYDDGDTLLLVLPIEQNKVTDPAKIAALNAKLGSGNPLFKDIPSSSEDLPYSADVAEGDWYTETPAVNIIDGEFYLNTKLTLTNFSSNDRVFSVGLKYCDFDGTWYEHSFINKHDFGKINYIKFRNLTSMRYGVFLIGNLNGDPSPSYTYTISLSGL